MAEDETARDDADQGVPLLPAEALGRLLYPYAVAEILRVPPANDMAEIPPLPPSPLPSGG